MRKLLTAVLGLALLFSGVTPMTSAATNAAPQDCWMCYTDPEDDNLHWDDDSFFYEAYPPDYAHASKGVGSCGDSHQIPVCPPAPEATVELIADAVKSRDADALVEAFTAFEGRAILNLERQAIQITSCSDENIILAHLQIDDVSFDTIAVSLAAVATSSEASPR